MKKTQIKCTIITVKKQKCRLKKGKIEHLKCTCTCILHYIHDRMDKIIIYPKTNHGNMAKDNSNSTR